MLLNGKWARKYDCCIKCGTTEKSHCSNGKCVECYNESNRKYKKGSWARDFDKCIKCGTSEINHQSHGLCLCCSNKKYYKNNKKSVLKREREYYRENEEKLKKDKKNYRENNKEKVSASRKKYRKKNIVKISKEIKKYYEKNKIKINKKGTERNNRRRRTDPRFKLRSNVSSLVHNKLKKRLLSKKGKSIIDFLPYTIDNLIQHLEELFTEGMTWNNYGKWHIDHKRPDCSFNYKSVEDKEFQKCWALKNLQPLWAIDNLKKGRKWKIE